LRRGWGEPTEGEAATHEGEAVGPLGEHLKGGLSLNARTGVAVDIDITARLTHVRAEGSAQELEFSKGDFDGSVGEGCDRSRLKTSALRLAQWQASGGVLKALNRVDALIKLGEHILKASLHLGAECLSAWEHAQVGLGAAPLGFKGG
jgi:hypothetical protein